MIQTSGHSNETARIAFVNSKLSFILKSNPGVTILDLGAGLSPFKELIVDQGGKYVSQDFSLYIPNKNEFGLQNSEWSYPEHDYTCDILEFDPKIQFDNLICTEVLEHVEDPITVLRKISELVRPNGKIIITVPMLSLVHQAPHYYSSGLSIFWFEKWAPRVGLQIDELVISGDYADMLDQEISRGIAQLSKFWSNRLIIALKNYFILKVRKFSKPDLLQSGGFSIFVVATKL